MAAVAAISCAVLLLHLWFNNGYGYFRDEFDYISCGNHLAWGYVDQPPLIPFLARISILALGDSLRAVRFIPALASSLLVFQTALLAHELGGRTFAVLLSAVTIVIAPQYLSNGSLLGTNCLEPNLWMGCVWFAILAIRREDLRYWFWYGVVLGIGLEEVYDRCLRLLDRGGLAVYAGAARSSLPVVLAGWSSRAPGVFTESDLEYQPPLAVSGVDAEHQGGAPDVILPAGQYLLQQMLLIHPVAAPIWICGLVAFLISPGLKSYRLFGWSYLICYAVFFVLHGKNYYLAPIYPILLAGGAVTLGRRLIAPPIPGLNGRSRRSSLAAGQRRLFAPDYGASVEPGSFLVYVRSLPFRLPVMEYSHAQGPNCRNGTPTSSAGRDRRENGSGLAAARSGGTRDCGIFAQNYGQAGAIDFLGSRYGLPPALSGHQTWFLWGPRRYTGNCLIVLDDRREVLERLWWKVDYAGTSAANPYALEQQLPVFICAARNSAH